MLYLSRPTLIWHCILPVGKSNWRAHMTWMGNNFSLVFKQCVKQLHLQITCIKIQAMECTVNMQFVNMKHEALTCIQVQTGGLFKCTKDHCTINTKTQQMPCSVSISFIVCSSVLDSFISEFCLHEIWICEVLKICHVDGTCGKTQMTKIKTNLKKKEIWTC